MIQPTLGIIGGSGLYALETLSDVESFDIETPFGKPSDPVRVGTIGSARVAFIARHGVGHRLSPSDLPYAANIYALKVLGINRLVSISAVGSLREDYAPRSLVVPNDTIDRTVGRRRTFFDDGVVAHVSFAPPFCPGLSRVVSQAAVAGGLPVHAGGTYVCIEGPQFSTRAESEMYRSWGASVIGMTALPEARLAREAELCYACLAMVTDYDVWHDHEGPVSVAGVVENLHAMTDAVQRIVGALASADPGPCSDGCDRALEHAIVTDSREIDEGVRDRLRPIAGRYLDQR